MSLPNVNLDDRTFQDIVDEAKRLIPQLCPEWTNLGPADPGMALVEVFAWMTEMVIFRLNQVPDALSTRLLGLIGVEPYPAGAARTELTFWLTTELPEQVVVPAGAEVATGTTGTDEVVFSTVDDLVIRPANLVEVLARDDDRWLDGLDGLAEGVEFHIFGDGQEPAWYVGFDEPLTASVIRLTLDCSPYGIGDPGPFLWEYWSGDHWVPAFVSRDDTRGLNLTGSIVIHVSGDHAPVTLGRHRAHWLRCRHVGVGPDGSFHPPAPRRIRGISAAVIGGIATAEHSLLMPGEVIGISNGQPGQSFVVRSHPVLPRRPDETVVVFADGLTSEWVEVADFLDSGPDDRHVTWSSSTGEIRFGPRIRNADGTTRQHGAVPPFGSEIAVTSYRVGGGAAGNVGAGTLRQLRTTVPYVAMVENLVPAVGGVDAETIDNLKRRGPDIVRRGHQLITSADYERLVLANPNVARVRCAPPPRPGAPVQVYVVPRAGGAPGGRMLDDLALSDGLVSELSQAIDERRVLGVMVEVGAPTYQGVSVAARIRARLGRPAEVIRHRALDALHAFIDPITGGRAGTGWPFGDRLTTGMLAGVLEGVDGVGIVDDVVLFDVDLRTGRRVGFEKQAVWLDADSLFLSFQHQVVVE